MIPARYFMRFPPPVRCFLILGEARYKAKPKSVFVKGDFRMLSEFKAFVMRGNVLDLAIAVIIGGAFATITKSLTDDVIMPVVGRSEEHTSELQHLLRSTYAVFCLTKNKNKIKR